jgi:hypothetical protein
MLHQEADGISASSATKTFEDLLGRGNGERRRLFIVKRTKAKIVGAPFLQPYEASDDFSNIDAAEDLLYGLLGDQVM